MGFYGAAWDGERVRVEPLSPRFDLAIHRKERNARHAIASIHSSLRPRLSKRIMGPSMLRRWQIPPSAV